MEENLKKFIADHCNDDTDRLLLGKSKWPDIDVATAVNCILSRRKLCGKVPEWYSCPGLLYPNTLSAEQCSSTPTAAYKAKVCGGFGSNSHALNDCWRIADLTGGLGVDSWAFAKAGAKVLHNEMDPTIHACAKHNFAELGLRASETSDIGADILCRNFELRPDNIDEILNGFRPDVIFLDPARRSQAGGKVFRLEDCSPNLLEVAAPLLERCPRLVVKISPMADISLICKQLGEIGAQVREVHIVGTGGECKELLLEIGAKKPMEIGTEAASSLRLTVVECHESASAECGDNASAATFSFIADDEKLAVPHFAESHESLVGCILFEPGKALMKAGAYNLLCSLGLTKLGASTHLYLLPMTGSEVSSEANSCNSVSPLGKTFRIKEVYPLDKRSLKAVGKAYPRSEVTARNIPMTSDELRKRLGVSSGDDAHIFGVRCDFTAAASANLLLVCERL